MKRLGSNASAAAPHCTGAPGCHPPLFTASFAAQTWSAPQPKVGGVLLPPAQYSVLVSHASVFSPRPIPMLAPSYSQTPPPYVMRVWSSRVKPQPLASPHHHVLVKIPSQLCAPVLSRDASHTSKQPCKRCLRWEKPVGEAITTELSLLLRWGWSARQLAPSLLAARAGAGAGGWVQAGVLELRNRAGAGAGAGGGSVSATHVGNATLIRIASHSPTAWLRVCPAPGAAQDG